MGRLEGNLARRVICSSDVGRCALSMLAAAGLSATWLFRKARVPAIFDDLDTVLLMIPLKMMIVGFAWQLLGVIGIMVILLWSAWRYLHVLKLPAT